MPSAIATTDVDHESPLSLQLGFLNWLCDPAPPPLPEELATRYFTLAVQHRFVGRMLEKILDADTSDQQLHLIEQLSILHNRCTLRQVKAEQTSFTLFTAAEDIADTFLLIKGMSLFRVTDNPFHIVNSSDRDVLIRHSANALPLIERFNTVEKKAPAPHEEVNLWFKGFSFDFHNHFPIWRHLGKPLTSSAIQQKTSELEHHANVRITEISYEDIAERCVPRVLGHPRVLFPNATIAAFIQIVHLYRDLIRLFVISMRARPRIRLQELADIRDFFSAAEFDAADFNGLVRHYDVAEQVQLCGSYVLACFGDRIILDTVGLPPLFTDLREPIPFVADIWYGFPVTFDMQAADLLFSDMFPWTIGPLVAENTVRAAERHTNIGSSQRIHYHGTTSTLTGSLSVGAESILDIVFTAESQAGDTTFQAFVLIGFDYFHFNFSKTENRLRYILSNKDALLDEQYVVEGDAHRLRLRIRTPEKTLQLPQVKSIIAVGHIAPDHTMTDGALVAFSFHDIA